MTPSMRGAWTAWLALAAFMIGCAPSSGVSPGAVPPSAAPPSGAPPVAAPPLSAAAPASNPPAAAPEPVTVHIFGKSVTTAIQQYAIEKGFFRDEGLDVTLQLADASIGVQLAATGQVEFTASLGSAIAGAVRGVPVKAVFVSGDRPPWWMYSDPSITTIRELRGKKIGASSAGSSLNIVARLIMERHGLAPDDFTILNLGSPQRVAALQSGAVDAAFLVAPQNLVAEGSGFRHLFNARDEGVLLITEGLATGDGYLQEKPDVVRRMVRASVLGLRRMRDDHAGAIDTMARFTEISPEEARQIFEFVLPTWTPDGTAEPATLRQTIEIMKLTAEVDTPVAEEQVFDLRMAREVATERP
jgi:ABC-type nitrate/sulfonate/bicarbonate transport system substrate-binding protein